MSTDYRLRKLNGEYVAVWWQDGKRRRWRLGATNETEARAALRIFVQDRERAVAPAEPFIEELWHKYYAEKVKQRLPSVRRMDYAWRSALKPAFGHLYTRDISDDLVRDHIEQQREHLGDGTILTNLLYLRACLQFAEERNDIECAPKIILPPKPRPRDRFLDAVEARELIRCAEKHIRLFILLGLYTGARPSSILDLTWDRVYLDRRIIEYDNPKRDRTRKGRARVPIADALYDELVAARREAQTEYVIEYAGQRVKSVTEGFKTAVAKAGLEGVTPYVLRHTFGVWNAERGVPMSIISQCMGHSSTKITEGVYAKFTPGGGLQKAVDAISDTMNDLGFEKTVGGFAQPVDQNGKGSQGAQNSNRGAQKPLKTAEMRKP